MARSLGGSELFSRCALSSVIIPAAVRGIVEAQRLRIQEGNGWPAPDSAGGSAFQASTLVNTGTFAVCWARVLVTNSTSTSGPDQ